MSKYSGETFSYEFREIQATTMSMEQNGSLALLAGRKYLGIVNLENTQQGTMQLRIPYGGKYEISKTQWSYLTSSICAIASSQKCDIFQLTDGSELKKIYQLKAHTRVITDLDWSNLSPNLLATSSFDNYLFIWDIRCPRDTSSEKAQISLSALDGASQVTWNKWKSDCLASCDGGHVKIWDTRKPNAPTEYIAAHASKINGLEWVTKDTVITAAQDCTARFSKLAASNPTKLKGQSVTLTTPIWRARPTPFGKGIVTQCVPLLRRDSGLLSLWNWQAFTSPIYTIQGHDILEFAWRSSLLGYELVTWSRDQTLRIWLLNREILEMAGEDFIPSGNPISIVSEEVNLPDVEEGEEITEADSTSSSGMKSNGESPPKNESPLEKTLVQNMEQSIKHSKRPSLQIPIREELLAKEFDSIDGKTIDNLNFEQVDLDRGVLRITWKCDSAKRFPSVSILVSFPINYPSALPTFLITSGASEIDKHKLLKSLKQVAQSCLRKNELCLLSCVTTFLDFMNQVKPYEDLLNPYLFPSRGASNVPFPRTSGARFCSVGVLVCFGRPAYFKKVKSNCDAGTPRSLQALGAFLLQMSEENTLSTPPKSRRKKETREKKRAGLVTLFDVTPLLPLTREIAKNYKHLSPKSTKQEICEDNSIVAKSFKKYGIGHIWNYCSIISNYTCSYNHQASESNNIFLQYDDEEINWYSYHPLGMEAVHQIITHYANFGDVQTAAAISCQFSQTQSEHASGFCKHGYPIQYLYPGKNTGNVLSSSNANVLETNINPTSQNHAQSQPWTINLTQPQQQRPRLVVPKKWTKGMGGSPYHTVHGSDSLHGVAVTLNPVSNNSLFRQQRSNSWSDSLDDPKSVLSTSRNGTTGTITDAVIGLNDWESSTEYPHSNHLHSISYQNHRENGKSHCRGYPLDPTLNRLYDGYKKTYAEILYRWGYLQQRSGLMKCLTEVKNVNDVLNSGVEYVTFCELCEKEVNGSHCSTCKKVTTVCAICHMPAKGLSTYCAACGHGGHATHIWSWFSKGQNSCPTGCGCNCIEENNSIFN